MNSNLIRHSAVPVTLRVVPFAIGKRNYGPLLGSGSVYCRQTPSTKEWLRACELEREST